MSNNIGEIIGLITEGVTAQNKGTIGFVAPDALYTVVRPADLPEAWAQVGMKIDELGEHEVIGAVMRADLEGA